MDLYLNWLIDFGRSLDWLLNLIGLLGYPVAIYLWLRERARYRRLKQLLALQPSDGAIAMTVGVGVPSVKADAEQFISETFDQPIPVALAYEKLGFFAREELLDIIKDLRNQIRELMVVGGIREVHLFYGGPVAVAAALGAITDNWVPVRWYNHNKKTGQYELAFTLDVETVKGI